MEKIFSNNAIIFFGTSVELKYLHKLETSHKVSKFSASEGNNWKFSPPSEPSFCGLLDASFKAFKYHLKTAVVSTHLAFE